MFVIKTQHQNMMKQAEKLKSDEGGGEGSDVDGCFYQFSNIKFLKS